MPRIELGNVTVDRDRFEVWVGERRVELTFVEFDLLHLLMKNAGKVLSRPKMMLAIWNEGAPDSDRKLTVHMSRLRKKIRGSDPWRIETIPKRGYGFVMRTEGAMLGVGEHATN